MVDELIDCVVDAIVHGSCLRRQPKPGPHDGDTQLAEGLEVTDLNQFLVVTATANVWV